VILDRIFWVWFVIVGFISVYLLFLDPSPYWFVFPLLLIGIGLDRLADEKEGREKSYPVKAGKKLLDKLKSK
jgi:hypothetical protein